MINRKVKDGDYVITIDGKNGIAWDLQDDDAIGVLLKDGGDDVVSYRIDEVFFSGDGEFTMGDRVVVEEHALQCGEVLPISDAITGTVMGVYYDKVAVIMDDYESVEYGVLSYYFKEDVSRLV